MYNIGILMHGDPTRKGAIKSEVKFLRNLYANNQDCNFYIITTSESLTKKIESNLDIYSFRHDIVTLYDDNSISKLDNMSCIVTYPSHSNFYAGAIAPTMVRVYAALSYATNIVKIPVFIRLNDSEIKVRDYKLLCSNRADGESQKEHSNFFTEDNVYLLNKIGHMPALDYTKVYWLANGSKEAYDWTAETLYHNEKEEHRYLTPELATSNTIYISDDVFFLIRENMNRFSHYDNPNRTHNNDLVYIGFFDTVNTARINVFKKLFKENKHNIGIKIFGKGTEALNKISAPNIDIEEGFIEGDSEQYFDFLNNHLAYVFIGKGRGQARYIGKTAYDAMVARIPILVYKPADEKQILFDDDTFYFTTEAELAKLVEKLKSEEYRQSVIELQRQQILSKLPHNDFKFDAYAKEVSDHPTIKKNLALF